MSDGPDWIGELYEHEVLPHTGQGKPKPRPTMEARMTGKGSKRKGDRGEREALKLLGDRARRGFGDRVSGDLRIIRGPLDGKVEVKRERAPLPRAYRLIEGHRAVMVRGDKQEWLMVLRAKDVAALLDLLDSNGGDS